MGSLAALVLLPETARSTNARSRSRPGRRTQPAAELFVAEPLESRLLLAATTVDPGEALDLVGRANDGTWLASSPDSGGLSSREFANWNPAADWRHVRSGDFDGDGLDDIAGWDASGGTWWATLSDPVGSTTLRAGVWSNATAWFDVAVIDLVSDGRGDDLVGRDQWGTWWGAVANGDGTFRNVALTSWNADAGWRDVRFFDINRDGTTDFVGRASDGSWWAAAHFGNLEFRNTFLTQWRESAGWQDATVVRGYDDPHDGVSGDFRTAVLARTKGGDWWAWSVLADGSVQTRFIAAWRESAGWRDVLAANMVGDRDLPPGGPSTGEEVIGRTAAGQWYALDPRTLTTTLIGSWNEAAGWRDVQVVTIHTEFTQKIGGGFFTTVTYDDALIGRTAAGEWWQSSRGVSNPFGADDQHPLAHTRLGAWNEAAGWRDVHTADRLGGVPIEQTTGPTSFTVPFPAFSTITVYAHRTGTSVSVTDLDPAGTNGGRVSIAYSIPALAYSQTFEFTMPATVSGTNQTLVFAGRDSGDSYESRTRFPSTVRGAGGDDLLDARNGLAVDSLFGGAGLDTLLGDPGDTLEQ